MPSRARCEVVVLEATVSPPLFITIVVFGVLFSHSDIKLPNAAVLPEMWWSVSHVRCRS